MAFTVMAHNTAIVSMYFRPIFPEKEQHQLQQLEHFPATRNQND